MWVRTQSKKRLINCIGFELGTHTYGDDLLKMDVIIYGITSVPNATYTKVALGAYKLNEAKDTIDDIEKAVANNQKIYVMPEKC